MYKKTSTAILLLFIYLKLVSESYAQVIKFEQPEGTGPNVDGRSGSELVQNVFNNVVTIMFSVGILAFLIMLLWGGLDIITSGGNKDKVQGGRKRITTAIIGLVVMASAFFIANIVGQLVGINVLDQIRIPRLLDGE